MSENTKNIEQHVEGAARSLVELVNALETGGLQYPLEAYRIYSYLTRVAGEMVNALGLVEASLQGLHEEGCLMSDYRGEPLDEVTQSSGQARGLAGELNGHLGKAFAAAGYLAYNEAPSEQEQETAAQS
ncbi:hypothetical protein ABZT43_37680 [Streptomyces sp. NPDC005349]|uniref:hypothetical protein n=1 Tax=Streptomyces sp. NPDC005349 TaxID=3157037 RepID=UPI00339FA224